MLDKNEHDCQSLHEYIDLITEFRKSKQDRELWYRGQAKSHWKLSPSLWRYGMTSSGDNLIESNSSGEHVLTICPNEHHLLQTFIMALTSEGISHPPSLIHQLELAQHYNLPTNLLDWSSDPLVALYFASSGARQYLYSNGNYDSEDRYFSVWILDPKMINSKSDIFKRTKPHSEEDARIFDTTDKDDHRNLIQAITEQTGITYCFRGFKADRRIVRQSGNFTYSSSIHPEPIDFLEAYEKHIWKINFPYSVAQDTVEVLRYLDLTDESIYFGKNKMDEIALKIKKSVLLDFHKYVEEWLKSN